MPEASQLLETLVKLADIPGHGRSLLTTRHIRPGEILLSDSPLLIYPAIAASSSSSSPSITQFCYNCFRSLRSAPIPCPSCTSAVFCSTRCFSVSLSSSHSFSICRALGSLHSLSDPDLCSQVHFLIAAFLLSSTSPANFLRLLSLDSGNYTPIKQDLISIYSILGPIIGFPLELSAELIAKDKRNAFGLMEPFREENGGARSVRAYAIYPNASFFNHDCLPNACRFDYLDRDGDYNTDLTIRAIHDIPEGREICLSYFPVNWGFRERQMRLMEDYEFQCKCDRCEVEKNWKIDDVDEEEDMEEVMEEDACKYAEDEDDDFPHAYFFVRYVCDREHCGGTMAPLPPLPQGAPSLLIECNACGNIRNEDDCDGDSIMLDE